MEYAQVTRRIGQGTLGAVSPLAPPYAPSSPALPGACSTSVSQNLRISQNISEYLSITQYISEYLRISQYNSVYLRFSVFLSISQLFLRPAYQRPALKSPTTAAMRSRRGNAVVAGVLLRAVVAASPVWCTSVDTLPF